MTRTLIRIEDGVVKAEEVLLFLALMGLVVNLFLQVLFRFVVEVPLAFTEELSRILLIWTVFLGAARGVYAGQHFLVDIVFARLPLAVRRMVAPAIDVLTLVFLGTIAWISWQAMLAGAIQILPVLGISVAVERIAMPVGVALMAYHTLMFAVRRGQTGHASQNSQASSATHGEMQR